jgi:hypothetical protein
MRMTGDHQVDQAAPNVIPTNRLTMNPMIGALLTEHPSRTGNLPDRIELT